MERIFGLVGVLATSVAVIIVLTWFPIPEFIRHRESINGNEKELYSSLLSLYVTICLPLAGTLLATVMVFLISTNNDKNQKIFVGLALTFTWLFLFRKGHGYEPEILIAALILTSFPWIGDYVAGKILKRRKRN